MRYTTTIIICTEHTMPTFECVCVCANVCSSTFKRQPHRNRTESSSSPRTRLYILCVPDLGRRNRPRAAFRFKHSLVRRRNIFLYIMRIFVYMCVFICIAFMWKLHRPNSGISASTDDHTNAIGLYIFTAGEQRVGIRRGGTWWTPRGGIMLHAGGVVLVVVCGGRCEEALLLMCVELGAGSMF